MAHLGVKRGIDDLGDAPDRLAGAAKPSRRACELRHLRLGS